MRPITTPGNTGGFWRKKIAIHEALYLNQHSMLHTTDIVILGAGIGGYETFRSLAKRLRRRGLQHKILLVDHNNYFTFAPMHHEAATGSIEPVHCTLPLREVVAGTPHSFLRAGVISIDPKQKIVETSAGRISYGYCVVALGSMVNFNGIPGTKEYTHHVRTLPAAMALQRAIIRELEACKDVLHIAVVGGGQTGVEMAGQLADFARRDVRKLYPGKRLAVTLIENEPEPLSRLPERARRIAQKKLSSYGVEMHFGTTVTEVRENSVITDRGEIPAALTVWTAGFYNVATKYLHESYCERGRIPVTAYMNHKREPTLYAVGDIALAYNSGQKKPQPQLGEAAHRQGEYVARHIAASMQKRRIRPFVFRSLGTLMPIGDWNGIAIFGPIVFGGWFAWWLRRTVYVLFMPGIIRKIRIVLDWTLHSLGPRYMVDVEKK